MFLFLVLVLRLNCPTSKYRIVDRRDLQTFQTNGRPHSGPTLAASSTAGGATGEDRAAMHQRAKPPHLIPPVCI